MCYQITKEQEQEDSVRLLDQLSLTSSEKRLRNSQAQGNINLCQNSEPMEMLNIIKK